MTETGTVTKLKDHKSSGLIRRPDGSELFFNFNKYPRGPKPTVGDELEYEVKTNPSKTAGEQDFADQIKVVKRGSATSPQPSTTPATPAPAGVAPMSPPPTSAGKPQIDVRLEGYPDNTIMHFAITEDSTGKKLAGDLKFFLRWQDHSPLQPFKAGPDQVILPVIDGKTQSWPMSMVELKTSGWTLLAEFGGTEVPIILPELAPAVPPTPALPPTPAPAPAVATVSKPAINLEGIELKFEKLDDPQPISSAGKVTGYKVRTLVKVSRNSLLIEDIPIDFLRETVKEAECGDEGIATNESGEVPYTFRNITPGGTGNTGFILLRARIHGTSKEKSLRLDIPKTSRDNSTGDAQGTGGSVTLTATASGGTLKDDGMHYRITLQATTRSGRNFDIGRIDWEASDTVKGDVDGASGYATHPVVLDEPGEHTYVARSASSKVSSRPIKLFGPPKKDDTPKSLEAMLLRTEFSEKKAIHKVMLKALNAKGTPVNAGKALWSLGTNKGDDDVDLSKGVEIIDVETDSETELPFTAFTVDGSVSLNKPLMLSGPNKQTNLEPDRLKTDISPYPDSDDFFSASVTAMLGKDQVKGEFSFSFLNATACVIKDDIGNEIGNGRSLTLKTEKNGCLTFFFNVAKDTQTLVTWKLPTGWHHSEPVANLTLKRQKT